MAKRQLSTRKAHTRTWPCCHPDRELLALRTVRNIPLLLKSPVYGILPCGPKRAPLWGDKKRNQDTSNLPTPYTGQMFTTCAKGVSCLFYSPLREPTKQQDTALPTQPGARCGAAYPHGKMPEDADSPSILGILPCQSPKSDKSLQRATVSNFRAVLRSQAW
jgi:hypothetical protein